MRVALAHDYLNQSGGAENVVEVFCRMFPEAPLYTSVYDRDAMPDFWQNIDVRTSYMQHITPRLKIAKRLLPLYPSAFESFDFSEYDAVLSSCSTFAKGVITGPETVHVCYCHNTTRPLWMYHEYVAHEERGLLQRAVLPAVVGRLRQWDYLAAQRVDHFIANSQTTAARIRKYYGRDSVVIEPPIRVSEFAGGDGVVEPYFLVISRLQSYKRIDLAVQVANMLQLRLLIAGRGPDMQRLRAMAGPTVEFLGRVTNAERVRLLQRCGALILPGREDFGLTALEAQAAGRPVIAFGAGGALETVVDGSTGSLFYEQSVESLAQTIQCFDAKAFDPAACRTQAGRFDEAVFKQRIHKHLAKLFAAHGVTAQ
ncbi:MAG: glycosyltransferase family 4 protein [Chloroflexi bacterium]|nr:glycosyltransferase family 4 protein [Chloroflexota bacterium]